MVSNKLQIAMLLTAQADKGFTVNTKFESPKTGYTVSMARGEMILDELDPRAVQAWVTKYYEKVRCNSTRYFGVWVDEGKYYFDISVNFDSLPLALGFGINNSQIAIWDVGQMKEIRL